MVICFATFPYNGTKKTSQRNQITLRVLSIQNRGGCMARPRAGKGILVFIIVLLVGWPMYQIYDIMKPDSESVDPEKLLFQVSLFQVELLNSFLQEASTARTTDQLNALKQAAYSVDYTHERFVLLVGDHVLTPLYSVNELMQFIMRLQIGGNRLLKADELEMIRKSGEQFRQLYEAYESLLSSGGSIINSQSEKISELDQAIYDIVHEQLLQS